jgi:hypothetical protein
MAQDTGRDPAAIRAGIERAREEVEASVAALRTSVSETLDWRNFVRRRPGVAFGVALATGVLVARATSR